MEKAYKRTLLLEPYGMADAFPRKTPAESESHNAPQEESLSSKDTTLFRSATRAPLYSNRTPRPDIAHAVIVVTI